MDTTRTAPRTRTGLAAAVAALAALTVVLSGCSTGGTKADGTYYNEGGRLSIQGTFVEYRDFGCDANHFPVVQDKASATGTLNNDSTQITWASDDEKLGDSIVKGNDGVTVNSNAGSVTIRNYTFRTMDEKQALAGYKKCKNSVKGGSSPPRRERRKRDPVGIAPTGSSSCSWPSNHPTIPASPAHPARASGAAPGTPRSSPVAVRAVAHCGPRSRSRPSRRGGASEIAAGPTAP